MIRRNAPERIRLAHRRRLRPLLRRKMLRNIPKPPGGGWAKTVDEPVTDKGVSAIKQCSQNFRAIATHHRSRKSRTSRSTPYKKSTAPPYKLINATIPEKKTKAPPAEGKPPVYPHPKASQSTHLKGASANQHNVCVSHRCVKPTLSNYSKINLRSRVQKRIE